MFHSVGVDMRVVALFMCCVCLVQRIWSSICHHVFTHWSSGSSLSLSLMMITWLNELLPAYATAFSTYKQAVGAAVSSLSPFTALLLQLCFVLRQHSSSVWEVTAVCKQNFSPCLLPFLLSVEQGAYIFSIIISIILLHVYMPSV